MQRNASRELIRTRKSCVFKFIPVHLLTPSMRSAPAAVYCPSCPGALCGDCDASEHSGKLSARHRRVPIAEMRSAVAPRCTAHPGKDADLWCGECRAYCCLLCRDYGAHKAHAAAVVLREDAERGALAAAAKLVATALKAVAAATDGAEVARDAAGQVETAARQWRDEIDAAFIELRAAVNKRHAEVLATFERDSEEALRPLQDAAEAEERALVELQGVMQAAERLAEANDARAALSACGTVERRLSEITASRTPPPPVAAPSAASLNCDDIVRAITAFGACRFTLAPLLPLKLVSLALSSTHKTSQFDYPRGYRVTVTAADGARIRCVSLLALAPRGACITGFICSEDGQQLAKGTSKPSYDGDDGAVSCHEVALPFILKCGVHYLLLFSADRAVSFSYGIVAGERTVRGLGTVEGTISMTQPPFTCLTRLDSNAYNLDVSLLMEQ
eukprot:TRINITY_DN582_c0_g1_i5.p1 TRINITY_DN582_c0_g1~~TRINITY_DN582_c0_g1_i5.p1  ORF type:complete len:447 (+),score=91.18 TRINITY_DN582_c0_g1_i5:98-1438(+)